MSRSVGQDKVSSRRRNFDQNVSRPDFKKWLLSDSEIVPQELSDTNEFTRHAHFTEIKLIGDSILTSSGYSRFNKLGGTQDSTSSGYSTFNKFGVLKIQQLGGTQDSTSSGVLKIQQTWRFNRLGILKIQQFQMPKSGTQNSTKHWSGQSVPKCVQNQCFFENADSCLHSKRILSLKIPTRTDQFSLRQSREGTHFSTNPWGYSISTNLHIGLSGSRSVTKIL